MRVHALCAASFAESVRRAAGADPALSPPVILDNFDPASIEGYDLLYVKLHGLPNHPRWYGDDWQPAVDANQVASANLSGTVVFVASCHLYTVRNHQVVPGPMLRALFETSARAIVGGPNSNEATRDRVAGADLLGMYLRRFLALHLPPPTAFTLARYCTRTSRHTTTSTDDLHALANTLRFRIFTQEDYHD